MGFCCDISSAYLTPCLPKQAQFSNKQEFAFMSVISIKHIYSVFIKLNVGILG